MATTWTAHERHVLDSRSCEIAEVHQTISRASAEEAARIARLFAAAPELLEALTRIVERGFSVEAETQARAAIAKAEGR